MCLSGGKCNRRQSIIDGCSSGLLKLQACSFGLRFQYLKVESEDRGMRSHTFASRHQAAISGNTQLFGSEVLERLPNVR